MKMLMVLVFIIYVTSCSYGEIVDLPGLGKMMGTTGTTYLYNKTFHSFLGIPYAEPPVGENRFMLPIKKRPWTDTLDATLQRPSCFQLPQSQHESLRNVFTNESLLQEPSNISENCLFLDIHSPKIKNSSLPVLFYIHGGSFIEGSSHVITPGFFLEHDLVLVAPQYRLGPFGFLALEGTRATGNAGMYDLVMALQWVRENIASFGGDPERITISGISAGAASAALLYVSPLVRGSFSQALFLSGSAVAPWVVDTEPFRHSCAITQLANCSCLVSKNEALACMQNADPLTIITAYFSHSILERKQGRNGMGGTIPIVDGAFLPELPEVLLKKKEFQGLPMIMSTTRNEGIFLTEVVIDLLKASGLQNNSELLKHKITDILMGFSGITDPTYTVGAAITEKYFNPGIMGDLELMIPGITDFNGAAYFKGPALKMAELNSMRNGSTYMAMFSYNPDGKGVNHAADQKYLFPQNISSYTKKDFEIVQKLTALYASFVISGSPPDTVDGVQWKTYSPGNEAYLTINEQMQIKSGFMQEFAITEEERRRSSSASCISSWSAAILAVLALYINR